MRVAHNVAIFSLAVLAGGGVGCRSRQLAHDQDHIRGAVMKLHEDQIMDNLVRGRKGLPILHLDYVNMTGTITQTGELMGGGSQTVASSGYFNIPAASAAVQRVVTGVGNLSARANQVNQLTITAQPVTGSPEVYNAYLRFLKEHDRLRESLCPPPCEEALIVRCYDAPCPEPVDCGGFARWCSKCFGPKKAKVYYWVPRCYEEDFRRLSLYAVAVRGQPLALSQNFEATVLGVVDTKKIDDDAYELFVKLDRKVPNDRGYMVATIAGRLYEDRDLLKLLVNTNGGLKRAQPGEVLADDQQTDVVRLSVSLKTLAGPNATAPVKIEDLVKGLAGQKVGVRMENFVPTGSPTDRALQDVKSQLELFRLGQFQR